MSVISIRLQTRREPRCCHCGEYLSDASTELYGSFAVCTPCTLIMADAYYAAILRMHHDTDCAQWWSLIKGVIMFTPGPAYSTNLSPLLWGEHQLHQRSVSRNQLQLNETAPTAEN